MATLNLSANGPSISKSYQSVVDFPVAESARGSPTFAKWALFSVSTPLVSAFQRDTGNKESVLKVQDTGEGELANLLDEFSEGKVQFAFVKIIDVNKGLPKNVLIAWCGEGVPERTKGYFTSHLSTVSKFLHGYHVQITGRSDSDLTVEGIIQKVGDASGAKYTPGPELPTPAVPKPPVSSKPVFSPLRPGGVSASPAAAATPPVRVRSNDEDGWGPDAPPVTRTNLEKVQPAYKPTKVNMQELKSGKQPEPNASFNQPIPQRDDVVKGGYQPIGKVDIAAIRRQAREAGEFKDDRPEPVKGSYEPVGKVDIAAIRAKAQKTDEASVTTGASFTRPESPSKPRTDIDSAQSNRLTSLPKPKVSNRFGVSSTFTGTKPPLPGDRSTGTTPAPSVGSASRTFADEGGKTPAQIWAERKARERRQETHPVTTPAAASTIQNDQSGGGEWKGSYSGEAWVPVQTTQIGKSLQRSAGETAGPAGSETSLLDPTKSQKSVSAIRDQLTQGPAQDAPGLVESVTSPPKHVANDAEIEPSRQHAAPQSPPPESQPPRSPTPERESSPIRVVMPVARETTDTEEPAQSPAPDRSDSPQRDFSDIRDQTDGAGVAGSIAAEAVHVGDAGLGDVRAVVQFDYDKAEDNEIDLKEGDYVTEIEMVDKDWWLGLNVRGERGLFPSNYVEVIEDNPGNHAVSDSQPFAPNASVKEPVIGPTPSPGSHNGKPTARALYDYEAAEDNELSFPEDAKITNIEFPDDDWWFGEHGGRTGLFPANYVQLEA
ncbi:hypothetical protein BJX61DRAFT_535191 [Aspergillus egyptiacus]|nr:hypothetical protein BJX61DRAFT_535191 [Aspergillus egyptiacus]